MHKLVARSQAMSDARRLPLRYMTKSVPPTALGVFMRCALRGFLWSLVFIAVSNVERSIAQSALNYGILANIESNPSDGSSNPHSFTESANAMYFLDRDGKLWVTDGTRHGTQEIPLKGSSASSLQVNTPRSMVAFNDTIAFAASFNDPTGSAGCRQSTATSPSCESQGLFIVNSDNSGVTLIREKVYIAESPAGKINERRILSIGQKLVFFGIESHDAESWWDSNSLWVSDGTRSGTFLLHTLDGGDLSVKQKIAAGGRLYFAIYGSQTYGGLWTSDGTVAGTFRINSNFAEEFRYHNGMLFFREIIYQNYQYNYYLSRLDPLSSPSEIRMRVALSSNVYSGLSFPLLYPSGNYVYFLERVNNYRDQFLHLKRAKTSNLEISTVQQVQEPKSLTDFRGTLYFVATTDETGEELFRVQDGGYYGSPTVALASDIRIGRSGSSPASLTPMGDELFF